ncbi:hypothetical protein K7711_41265 [Nocardia sp. CA2R105]|uniref:hypothetical protein n=1 Tax=Nocardia coffeae TaxID=2873381 RepID=UPI001CA6C581|nr:hypothetical protein [Nocardia coffeae]MBY8862960.1 hypothetical protein [Nocardia coffeae]
MSREATAAWFSFTQVFDGHHVEFDRWHALDHMPEQFGIEGVVGARRWTADRGLEAAGSDDDLTATHHAHMYLLADPFRRTLEEMTMLASRLAEAGRWFDARRGLLHAPFHVTGKWVSPDIPVRPVVLPYRPDRGAHIVVLDSDHSATMASALAQVPGVAGCWSFESMSDAELPPGFPAAPAGTGIVVAWLDEDPAEIAELLNHAVTTPVRYARTLRPAHAYQG